MGYFVGLKDLEQALGDEDATCMPKTISALARVCTLVYVVHNVT
jgi:hypothetical protein